MDCRGFLLFMFMFIVHVSYTLGVSSDARRSNKCQGIATRTQTCPSKLGRGTGRGRGRGRGMSREESPVCISDSDGSHKAPSSVESVAVESGSNDLDSGDDSSVSSHEQDVVMTAVVTEDSRNHNDRTDHRTGRSSSSAAAVIPTNLPSTGPTSQWNLSTIWCGNIALVRRDDQAVSCPGPGYEQTLVALSLAVV